MSYIIREKSVMNSIPSPEEFFKQITALDNELDVNKACTELVTALAEKHTPGTVSKKLTAYRKLLYAYQSESQLLNEVVETKDGTKSQHIAARLLKLPETQKEELEQSRNEKENARAGFDSNGDIRDVDNPKIDIAEVIEQSVKCLSSNDPYIIGAGILNLTGLRPNEQNIPTLHYPEWDLLITRNMVVLDKFLIGFKGVSKKKTAKDTELYYARATLAPAKIIVEAQKRFLESKQVKAIPTNYENYRSNFLKTFNKKFMAQFGETFTTIEAMEDDGKIIKANGTPHKGRAFYACALRGVLKLMKVSDKGCIKYIQQCLAHESEGITMKYLSKYDEQDFINPIKLNIPSNIKELGLMTTAPVAILEPVSTPATEQTITPKAEPKAEPKATPKVESKIAKTSTKTTTKFKELPNNIIDIEVFTFGLESDLKDKFVELQKTESNLTNALLALVQSAKQSGKNQAITNKISVIDEIQNIVNAIMVYNREQTLNTNRVVPGYALLNKIASRVLNKTFDSKTVERWLDENDELHQELVNMDIKGGIRDRLWNNKHHRKTMDVVIESVVKIFNQ